jgi:hypothetical protein
MEIGQKSAFSLRSLLFRFCFPSFRFEAKQAKKRIFIASKRIGKSADPILHHEPPLFKNIVAMRRSIFNK